MFLAEVKSRLNWRGEIGLTPGRPGRRHQDVRDFLKAEHHGQPALFGPELHEPLHLLPPAGHAEEEPQRHDAGVEGRGHHPCIGHVQLVGAQLFRRGGVGRSTEEGRKILHGANMGPLGLLAHASNAQVLDHPLAQRGGSFLRHGNLLSVEGGRPRSLGRNADRQIHHVQISAERQTRAPLPRSGFVQGPIFAPSSGL
jgi:hypothetical protein